MYLKLYQSALNQDQHKPKSEHMHSDNGEHMHSDDSQIGILAQLRHLLRNPSSAVERNEPQ
jgi:hypothetical protein